MSSQKNKVCPGGSYGLFYFVTNVMNMKEGYMGIELCNV